MKLSSRASLLDSKELGKVSSDDVTGRSEQCHA